MKNKIIKKILSDKSIRNKAAMFAFVTSISSTGLPWYQ